mmetsp:Transcript_42076/g.105076  ORF Transcript_42076/g.105076 Transcript_42076/m.105076 type:complete len:230 (+) Transcript_42076:2100-2789(+)
MVSSLAIVDGRGRSASSCSSSCRRSFSAFVSLCKVVTSSSFLRRYPTASSLRTRFSALCVAMSASLSRRSASRTAVSSLTSCCRTWTCCPSPSCVWSCELMARRRRDKSFSSALHFFSNSSRSCSMRARSSSVSCARFSSMVCLSSDERRSADREAWSSSMRFSKSCLRRDDCSSRSEISISALSSLCLVVLSSSRRTSATTDTALFWLMDKFESRFSFSLLSTFISSS